MKDCVSCLWKMDEKLPRKDERLCVSCYSLCERYINNLLKKHERLWVKDETLCVSLCKRWMKNYQRKTKHCVLVFMKRWMKKLPKKDETLCVSLCERWMKNYQGNMKHHVWVFVEDGWSNIVEKIRKRIVIKEIWQMIVM